MRAAFSNLPRDCLDRHVQGLAPLPSMISMPVPKQIVHTWSTPDDASLFWASQDDDDGVTMSNCFLCELSKDIDWTAVGLFLNWFPVSFIIHSQSDQRHLLWVIFRWSERSYPTPAFSASLCYIFDIHDSLIFQSLMLIWQSLNRY